MRAVLSEKGQITIPKPLRESVGIHPGEELEFEEDRGRIILKRVEVSNPLIRLVGSAQIKEKKSGDEILSEMRGGAYNPKLDR